MRKGKQYIHIYEERGIKKTEEKEENLMVVAGADSVLEENLMVLGRNRA
jgi:hypothetical protein